MITIRQVQDIICRRFDITRDDLLQPCRRREFARPRQIAMLLAREMTGKTLKQLGIAFCRDHSTVVTGCAQAAALRQDEYWAVTISEVTQDLLDPETAKRREFEIMMGHLWKQSVPRCFAPGAYTDESSCRAFIEEAA